MFKDTISFIKQLYNSNKAIPLHTPVLDGNEKRYLIECIDSTFVSSVGEFVDRFEHKVADYTGSKHAVAAVNGTAALHIALLLAGVKKDDEVITQPLTFVATANAISYTGAKPVFIDVDKNTMGLSPEKLDAFLIKKTFNKKGLCFNRSTGKQIKACVAMHTFGHPCRVDEIKKICDKNKIALIEDAAESLGSFYKNRHTGTFGLLGVFSFNGNKIVTTGSGGMIITDNDDLALRAKHITTTAKISHKWEYIHDEIGYNYRLANINAALGCAQMERLPAFVENKRRLARDYDKFFSDKGFDKNIKFIKEPEGAKSNYWLNTILLEDIKQRDEFLEYANNNGVMARPAWRLLNLLPMYKVCQADDLINSKHLSDRAVNLPSSVV